VVVPKLNQEEKLKLIEEWRSWYEKYSKWEVLEEQDFESICIGWCCAKGMTPDEGYDFYQEMIPLKLF
jgi:hypothetical protein